MPTDRNYGKLSSLSPQLRSEWDRMFASAMNLYNDKKYAEGTAWRAVRSAQGLEPDGTRARNPGQLLPDPGDTIILGKLLEYAYLQDGQLYFVKFKPNRTPDLLWSRAHKMLVAYPGIEFPQQRYGQVTAALRQEYQRWAQRNPRGAVQVRAPRLPVKTAGAADTVVYRSSKWTKVPGDPPGSQEYIHQFGERVAYEKNSDGDQRVIVFRGGKMDVLPAGIVN